MHKREGKLLVAVCDSELLGNKFEEGDKQLDLTSNFYKGEEKDELTVGDTIRKADTLNLVGEKAIKLGIKEGLIDECHVNKIANIPYAHAILVRE